MYPAGMFYRDALSVLTEEYPSILVSKPRARPKPSSSESFQFSFFRLSVAAAKSVLTRDPLSLEMWKEVRAAFYVLDSIVANADGNLRLAPGFRKRYRDFSKTSRTGELAQALTFVLAQDVLKYPIVCDFNGYLDSQRIPPMDHDKRTPDYALLFKNGSRNLSLIESKGSSPESGKGSPKTALSEALKQCKSADDYIRAVASYGAASSYGTHVRLAEASDSWDTVIAFCDPEEPTEFGPADPLGALRQYYAAWLVLAGAPYDAELFMEGRLSEDHIDSWARIARIDGDDYIGPSDRRSFDLFTPFKAVWRERRRPWYRMKWAVSAKVMKGLIRKDVNTLMQMFGQELDINPGFDGQADFFRDRTLCQWSE